MKTSIVRMLRLGRSYSVTLECGCKLHVTPEEAQRDQLFIGKTVTCQECGRRA